MKKYKCLVCGKETLEEPAGDSFQVCPCCGWEDDMIQNEDPDYDGGESGKRTGKKRQKC